MGGGGGGGGSAKYGPGNHTIQCSLCIVCVGGVCVCVCGVCGVCGVCWDAQLGLRQLFLFTKILWT